LYVAADATGRALANTAPCAPPCATHAVLYGPDGGTDLGTLGSRHTMASVMNASGHVVGWSQAATGARFTGYIHRNGQMTAMPAFMPNPPLRTEIISSAVGINDRDQVVGWSLTGLGSNGVVHGRAYLWEGGVMKDLGTLGGNDSSAVSINNAGDIVGYAGTVPGGDAADPSSAAFLYRGGTMYNLDGLLVPGGGAGWKIVEVIKINDEGFILGWATAPGSATPINVVLSPVQKSDSHN
jgi:probable HAF family extracellular repeat protein